MNRILFTGLVILLFSCGEKKTSPSNLENDSSHHETVLDSTEYFEKAIMANAASPIPYLNRAAWNLRNARVRDGLNDLDLALEADSTYGPAWSAKADALYLIQRFEKCIEHLDVCLELAPDHIPCKLRRAEMHIHLKQYDEAFDLLNDALRLDDQIAEAYWMKGMIYRETGDVDNALSSFQTSVEVNPSFFDGYIALGIAYGSTSNPLAVDYYKSAMVLRPRSVEAKYNLAMYYQELFLDNASARAIALEKSLALYSAILDIDSMNASAAFNQGYIYLEYLQDYNNAVLWFSEAIKRLPYYHQAFFNRGLARESLGLNIEALSDYDEALKLKPDYTQAALAKSRILGEN